MYLHSLVERAFIRINENGAEMQDGCGRVDRIFSVLSSNSDGSGKTAYDAGNSVASIAEPESRQQYYLRYRDELLAGMPVVPYEDYVSMYKVG